jgi:hypothetical protein
MVSGTSLTANVPAVNGDHVRLELRCPGWIPQNVMRASQDPRTLGVQGFTVTMRAEGASARVFNATTGKWPTATMTKPWSFLGFVSGDVIIPVV